MFRPIHLFKLLRKGLTGLLATGALLAAHAQIAQTPLLTQSGSVEPNLMLILDDSSSMDQNFIYQYGGSPGTSGMSGPSPSTWALKSPNVNLMAYDPTQRYLGRINADGTRQTATTLPGNFNVYFYKNASGSTAPMDWPNSGNDPTSGSSYFSPSFTVTVALSASMLAPGAITATYPQTVTTTASTFKFPKFKARTDCVSDGTYCTLAEERQNKAYYDAFYATRMDFALTAIGEAFQPLGATFRLGWSTLNADLAATTAKVKSGVSLFDDTRKTALFTWLYGSLPQTAATPTRTALDNAGKYFSRRDDAGPWGSTPSVTSTGLTTTGTVTVANQASCRRSYSMLATDGYYNDSFTLPSPANFDNSNPATITGTVNGALTSYTYSGSPTTSLNRLYKDSYSSTLADVAMKYWVTDLRPDLPNNGKPIAASSLSRGNPSFWQNMGFYAITLGVTGTLTQSVSTLDQLASGTTTWPSPSTNNPTAIDDTWHATINGRGQMLNANNAASLTAAVASMLAEINKLTSTQDGVAASTLSLNTGTKKYTPKYTTGSWIGNVVASNLDAASGADKSIAWQVVGTGPGGTPTYSGIPAHGSRNIIAATSATTWGSFNTSNTYASGKIVGGSNADLINYLRGDRTNEDPNGTAMYRPREELLGDIVNSTPVFIKGALNMSYEKLPTGTWGQASYPSFISSTLARPGVLIVGANDGMLHGFRDSDGVEAFAFVPQAVLPNMHELSQKLYAHRYYVDGPNVEAHACLGSSASCTWTDLLIGTAGAGAKTVFALDVSTTVSITASNVKWEITTATAGFTNLGHVLSDVQTGLTMGGEWVAVFGNGYESADGSARLYVANLSTGALIKDIPVDATGSNGLGGVRLVRDANQRIIGAYAGDLKGKMWKFDLFSSASSGWVVGLSGSPLYSGTVTQAITAAPAIVPNPYGGNVVSFGTGKFYQTTDLSTTTHPISLWRVGQRALWHHHHALRRGADEHLHAGSANDFECDHRVTSHHKFQPQRCQFHLHGHHQLLLGVAQPDRLVDQARLVHQPPQQRATRHLSD
jgi:type IV pilus assembly protein PilY1